MNMTMSADTLSVTCSGWTANDQVYTFEVRTLTQDCGFTSDAATNSVTLSGELLSCRMKPHLPIPSELKI